MRKRPNPALVLACLLLLSMVAAAKDEKAFINNEGGKTFIQVETGDIRPDSEPEASLFVVEKKNDEEQPFLLVRMIGNVSASLMSFRIDFPATHPFDPKESYVVVLDIPVKEGGVVRTRRVTLPVSGKLSVKLVRGMIPCDKGLYVIVNSNVGDFNWQSVYDWLEGFKANKSGLTSVGIHTDEESEFSPYGLQNFSYSQAVLGELRICLIPAKELPTKSFFAKVTLNGDNRPPEIKPELTSKKLAGLAVDAATIQQDVKATGDRVLERNLDLGVTLTSSVKNEEMAATATTPATSMRERTTRGVLDVRFAPVIDVLHPEIKDNGWMHFLTPFYINANVATGKIEEDTLALNRVLLGLEGEFRYRKVNEMRVGPNPVDVRYPKVATHRIIYGFTHASDRDFKQDEFTGKLEWKPIVWKLNTPIGLNWTRDKDTGVKDQKPYGYTFLPKFGFEIGRTYHRRNPAVAIKESDNVRRFYFGLDMSLDLTKHLSFIVSDTFYVRGETPDDRARNYFKGGVQIPFNNVQGRTVHSLFMTFERGDLPPFATPGVNAFKVGYRLQLNYCDKCR